jgi:transcriptional regulator with XRE-family HTH domain
MTLGNLIKKARTTKKWSLQKLADEMGVTKQLVWQWEKEETDARKHIQQLSQHLEVPTDYFYGPKRSPGALAAKIEQLTPEHQETLEMMVETFLRQQEQESSRKLAVK